MPRKKAGKSRKRKPRKDGRWRWIVPLALAATIGAGWVFRARFDEVWQMTKGGAEHVVRRYFQPDPDTYAAITRELERRRGELAARHRRASNDTERAAVEREARAVLEESLPALMHCWLGTPYDFNGTSGRPGKGKVACGYFVAAVLKDAGFRVDRSRLAQQASGNILRSFLPEKSCALTIGEDFPTFSARMRKRDPGVYVVGLDTHVAFIVADGNDFRFVHSTGLRPRCVVDQSPAEARTLRVSKWRMLGNLTADPEVLRTWIRGDRIDVKGA